MSDEDKTRFLWLVQQGRESEVRDMLVMHVLEDVDSAKDSVSQSSKYISPAELTQDVSIVLSQHTTDVGMQAWVFVNRTDASV